MRRATPYLLFVLAMLAYVAWPQSWRATPVSRGEAPARPGFHGVVAVLQASDAAPGRAPWSAAHAKYREGRYAELVANAWRDPEKGSLHFAAQAISDCLSLLRADAPARYRQRIESGDPGVRQARELAWQTLIRPCREFHDLAALATERSRIWEAIETSGDPANRLVLRTRSELRDTRIEREARQDKLEALLAMDDPFAMAAVVSAVTETGVTFEGEALSFPDRVAYWAAWGQVLCVGYGQCVGPDTRQGHWDCMYHGECGYLTPDALFELVFPDFVVERMLDYQRRIQAHLDRGRFSAFGLP